MRLSENYAVGLVYLVFALLLFLFGVSVGSYEGYKKLRDYKVDHIYRGNCEVKG